MRSKWPHRTDQRANPTLAPSRAPRSIRRRGAASSLALKLASSHRPEGKPKSGTITSAALDLETGGGQLSLALKLASSHRPEGEPNSGTVMSAALDLEVGGGQQSLALKLASSH